MKISDINNRGKNYPQVFNVTIEENIHSLECKVGLLSIRVEKFNIKNSTFSHDFLDSLIVCIDNSHQVNLEIPFSILKTINSPTKTIIDTMMIALNCNISLLPPTLDELKSTNLSEYFSFLRELSDYWLSRINTESKLLPTSETIQSAIHQYINQIMNKSTVFDHTALYYNTIKPIVNQYSEINKKLFQEKLKDLLRNLSGDHNISLGDEAIATMKALKEKLESTQEQ